MLSKVTEDKAVILNGYDQMKDTKNDIFKLLTSLNILSPKVIEII